MRSCACSHSYPLCACFEGLSGDALLRRSNWLSSLAGWPAPRLDPAEVARVVAEYGRPVSQMAKTPVWLALPRVAPATAAGDCGCNQGLA